MTSRTRSALQECLPSGRASVAHVAERVGVSRRTLQRRLAEEGATFRALLRTTRKELADHYLTATHLPLAEIAFLLGVDDPSSFFRAFREWTGTTPQRCRAEAAMEPRPGRRVCVRAGDRTQGSTVAPQARPAVVGRPRPRTR